MFESKYEDIIAAQNGDENKMASLVSKNVGLVYSITKRFQGRGFETEDLNQIGTLGLIKAIKQFNASYNVQLSTYCVPYILGEVKKYVRDDGKIKVSRSVKDLSIKINMVRKEYLKKRKRNYNRGACKNFTCYKRRNSISNRCNCKQCGNFYK